MKLTNKQIYEYAILLKKNFESSMFLPVKITFAINKNMALLTDLASEIENLRMVILDHYGIFDEEKNAYLFTDEKQQVAQKELNDLQNIEQDVSIYMIKENWLDGFSLTMEQMASIMFMIED